MPTDTDLENILSDFAMEAVLTPDVLRAYIQRYPHLALELTDLFHDLTIVDLKGVVESISPETNLESEQFEGGVAAVRAALSGSGLRDLALRLKLPRDFVAGFRDARVRLGSVPASVLLNLARAIDVKTQHFIAHLQRQHGTAGAVAFKADIKPQGLSVLEYDEFIESLGLNENEVAALERLAKSNGPH